MPGPRNIIASALILAIVSLWPLVGIFNWFGVNVATLEQMSRTDPLGFRVLPAVLMFARPLLALFAACQLPMVAVRMVGAPSQLIPRILLRAAAIQGALAVGLMISGGPVDATLARLLPMFADPRTPGAIVSPAHFVALQEAAAAAVIPPLLIATLVAAALAAAARATGSQLT